MAVNVITVTTLSPTVSSASILVHVSAVRLHTPSLLYLLAPYVPPLCLTVSYVPTTLPAICAKWVSMQVVYATPVVLNV
jgi:hypothetical protein